MFLQPYQFSTLAYPKISLADVYIDISEAVISTSNIFSHCNN